MAMTNLKPRKSKNVSYNPSTFALDQLSMHIPLYSNTDSDFIRTAF